MNNKKYDYDKIAPVLKKYIEEGHSINSLGHNKDFLKEINVEKISDSVLYKIARLNNINLNGTVYNYISILPILKKYIKDGDSIKTIAKNKEFLKEINVEKISYKVLCRIARLNKVVIKLKYDYNKIFSIIKKYVKEGHSISSLEYNEEFLKEINSDSISKDTLLRIYRMGSKADSILKQEKTNEYTKEENILPTEIDKSKEVKPVVDNKEDIINNDNISKEFVNTFFSNLEEPQKYIIEKLLEDKMLMNEKLKSIYKEFENKFIQLRDMTLSQIELSNKIKGGI